MQNRPCRLNSSAKICSVKTCSETVKSLLCSSKNGGGLRRQRHCGFTAALRAVEPVGVTENVKLVSTTRSKVCGLPPASALTPHSKCGMCLYCCGHDPR